MLKDLTEKIGSDLSKRWRDGRVKLDRFHACTPRIDERGPTCNQLSAAIRSSNGDRYGIGERLPIVCDRARPHINRWRERKSDRYETRGSSFDPSREGLGLEGGHRWMELDRSRGRSFQSNQGRTKFGFVDGWGKMEGEGGGSLEMGIVEREAIRGGDRDSRQITSG